MSLYSYKYRLNPTPRQEVLLAKHFGCTRFLYNYFLEQRVKSYKETRKTHNYYNNQKEIPKLKQTYNWLKEVGSQSLQYAIRQLQNGYDNFFRKVKLKVKGKKGFPKFKKKHSKQSFKILQNIKVENNKIIFPKFKEGIAIVLHRPLEGEIKFATINKNKAGQYHISITVTRNITKLMPTTNIIGIDLNVKSIVCSNKIKYKNPLPRTRYGKRLRLLKKAKNRTEKESKGRIKAWLKLNKFEQHIHNIREDFQHKVSNKIVNENQVIILETLLVKEMLKNKSVKERWKERAFHRKIADASFSSFIQKLKYKCEWYGRELRQVSQWFPSSQLCSVCGWQNKELTLDQREWTCCECFSQHDRDENAAMNIRSEGIRTLGTRGIAVCPDIRPCDTGRLDGTEAPTFRVEGSSQKNHDNKKDCLNPYITNERSVMGVKWD